MLLISYAFYVWFNMRTHHSIYDQIFLYEEHGGAGGDETGGAETGGGRADIDLLMLL
jgi:Ca2+/H+ antiporter